MALEDENIMDTSVYGSGVPSKFAGQGPSPTTAEGADTIHDSNPNAANEAAMILPSNIIPSMQTLAEELESAKLGSTTTGIHQLDNPHSKGIALLEVMEVLEKNNWKLDDSTANTSLQPQHVICKSVDFKSGLDDPMSYPNSLNGLAKELSEGTIASEADIANYREFLLVLAGDLLDI